VYVENKKKVMHEQDSKDVKEIFDLSDTHFEGPEKRIEIYFKLTEKLTEKLEEETLLSVSRERWDSILKGAKCSILSRIENKDCQAYLLSESSLFVWKDHCVLKTCGKTTLLECIPLLLEITSSLNLEPLFVSYSHRNFIEPHLQPESYQTFEKESQTWKELIASHFPPGHTETPLAKKMLEAETECEDSEKLYRFWTWKKDSSYQPHSNWIEVSTTELSDRVLFTFEKQDTMKPSQCYETFQNTTINEYWFEPQGYSCNLLGTWDNNGKNQNFYLTIHLTPQKRCPYLSIEGNLPKFILFKWIENYLGEL
jgi:S-adenosylmethionine decarboxylase